MKMRQILSAASFYPMTGLYLGGVILAMLASTEILEWPFCLITFGLLFVTMLLVAAQRELRQVHQLVDGQRTELLARVDHLTELLVRSDTRINELTNLLIQRGIQVPVDEGDLKSQRRETIQHPQTGQVVASNQ